MHLSKKILYLGIIGYSGALLIFQDWPAMTAFVGAVSAAFLVKMLLDVSFAGMAGIRLAGPALFADDEDDEDVAIHEEDLHFSDTALFGFFMLNVVANGGWHAYLSVMTVDLQSFYYSIWVIAEFAILLVTWVLFSHARKTQRRLARKSREAAKAAGSAPIRSRATG
jgi:hypothetical protein